MQIDCERLLNGGKLDLGDVDTWRGRPAGLRVLVGYGKGCVLHGTAAAATVLVPLRGRVQVADGDSVRTLAAGDALVVECGQRLQAIGRASALWIAVFAPADVWSALSGFALAGCSEPLLVPALHVADRSLRRAAARLARTAAAADRVDASTRIAAASVLATLIGDLQAEFDPLIERCPGRTLAQRRSVFLRLQRVRNTMESSCHLDLDIAGFARMASYSPCHFIRAFSAVFGETPHAVLVEQRLGRARRLIRESGLAITEIARASGFENRCAFSRSFKRRFGVSASELREHVRDAAAFAA